MMVVGGRVERLNRMLGARVSLPRDISISREATPTNDKPAMRGLLGIFAHRRKRATRVTHLIAFCFIRARHVNRRAKRRWRFFIPVVRAIIISRHGLIRRAGGLRVAESAARHENCKLPSFTSLCIRPELCSSSISRGRKIALT